MAEVIIRDFEQAYGIRSVCLRYFNVVGASSLGCIGDRRTGATSLMANILRTVSDPTGVFHLFGADYPSRDGTCVRDFISVEDLVDSHIKALTFLFEGDRSEIFNLGTGKGHTIREILAVCERVLQKKIPVIVDGRREGDPVLQSVASAQKAEDILGWHSQQSLEEAIRLAYIWKRKLLG
jgi:UDP-glucose 4-epimerase